MGSCSPSLCHRFQRFTLSGETADFVRWVTPGSRLPFHTEGAPYGAQSPSCFEMSEPEPSKSPLWL
eukprot:scaffold1484_cov67-Phaeocystis_antarctica.AAC.1